MKIFIDIGHPAHVHYFRNLIEDLSKKGFQFVITARDKEIAQYLLNQYKLEYISRGEGGIGILGKLFYMLRADVQLLNIAQDEKPDLFLSFGSPYAAQVSLLVGKPHIALDDTENATLGQFFYRPFTNCILSPSCFKSDFGKKHFKFPSYMELSYLHPNVYSPDKSVLNFLGVEEHEMYTILRFVGWGATHDVGHEGITVENKIKAVNEFKKYGKVFVSSEDELPSELLDYKYKLPPEKMHDALAFASLFYGESATMASESAVLGTPAIYLDNEGRGYTNELEKKYGLVFNYSESKKDQAHSIEKGVKILKKNDKQKWFDKKNAILRDKIDLTAFLKKFVTNYPHSIDEFYTYC